MQSVREVRVQSVVSCGQPGPLSKSYQRSDFQVPFLLAAGNNTSLTALATMRCLRGVGYETRCPEAWRCQHPHALPELYQQVRRLD